LSAERSGTIQILNAKSDYTDRNKSATPFYHEEGQTATFTRRIGNTVYRVNVHSSKTSKETLNDKIMRLVKNDISGKAANQ